MKYLKQLNLIVLRLISAHIKQRVVKLRLMWVKKQRNKSKQELNKYNK